MCNHFAKYACFSGILLFSLAVHAQNTPIFQTGIYNAGGPVAVADINHDGNLDIATSNLSNGTAVSVLDAQRGLAFG